MSNEVSENLREIASNLLAAANHLDGIDVTADAMRSGTATPVVLSRQTCFTCGESMIPGPDGMWWHGDSRDCVVAVTRSSGTATPERRAPAEPETVDVKVMTGRGFGMYVHRDPITPLQIGDCAWPDGPCDGHRIGLGGMPLLTVPDDQAVHVPHRHVRGANRVCSEIVCHETHGRPCRFCGGAPCRITPVERSA